MHSLICAPLVLACNGRVNPFKADFIMRSPVDPLSTCT
ncbi:hypothetical protein BURPS1106A_2052 [Burkholderia pseudomallei 1106a]|uniref:Uncharacterized protein n=1 Tax=Burkholderia pseudomallei (strain 1106a) TaxID=357348 RepID=A3NVE6_BURP0|nr:hypothetical protein BURPS1106A_2052 [Burkholderia pseudomallei 1106a]